MLQINCNNFTTGLRRNDFIIKDLNFAGEWKEGYPGIKLFDDYLY